MKLLKEGFGFIDSYLLKQNIRLFTHSFETIT